MDPITIQKAELEIVLRRYIETAEAYERIGAFMRAGLIEASELMQTNVMAGLHNLARFLGEAGDEAVNVRRHDPSVLINDVRVRLKNDQAQIDKLLARSRQVHD